MTAPLQPVSPNQPLQIPAGDYNAMIEAARAHHLRGSSSAGLGSGSARPETVLVRNDTAGDLGRFAVLGIDGPVIAPADLAAEFSHRVAVKGVTPTSDHLGNGRLVILAENLPAGELGHAYAGGVCPALIDMQAAGDTVADAADATTANLVSGSGPITILWADATTTNGGSTDGTGVQAALVRFGTQKQQASFLQDEVWDTFGTFSWTVPSGVTRLWMLGIAKGGAGGRSAYDVGAIRFLDDNPDTGGDEAFIPWGAGGGSGGSSGESQLGLFRVLPGTVVDIEIINGSNTSLLVSMNGTQVMTLVSGEPGNAGGLPGSRGKPEGHVGAPAKDAGEGRVGFIPYSDFDPSQDIARLLSYTGAPQPGGAGVTGGPETRIGTVDTLQHGPGGPGGVPVFRPASIGTSQVAGVGGRGGAGYGVSGEDGKPGAVQVFY